MVLQSVVGPLKLGAPSIDPGPYFILLGRRDVFARCRISFAQRALSFDIERY